MTYQSQNEIEKAIQNFYRNLYKKTKVKEIDKNEMFQNLPKIAQNEKEILSKPLSLDELHSSLKTCKESAPGPDGLTYNVYKKLWPIFGELIYKSWNHSNETGSLPNTQRDSIINLLEKKEKIEQKLKT